jgi:glycosyltransferase involved in cell wall biosynthesis
VSVVIPTFERADALRRAIASAQAQTWENLEILVVGDACRQVDGVVAGIGDPRVRHWNLARRAGDLGATPRNYALKLMARGSLIAYLDDDNWWEPDHLASLVEPLLRDPETTFAFSSFDMDGQVVEARAPRHMQVDTSALLHRRLLLERFGYWRPPTERLWAHDWELVSRWEGEPWAATLRPTLHYALASSHQTEADLAAILTVAADERERAGTGGG